MTGLNVGLCTCPVRPIRLVVWKRHEKKLKTCKRARLFLSATHTTRISSVTRLTCSASRRRPQSAAPTGTQRELSGKLRKSASQKISFRAASICGSPLTVSPAGICLSSGLRPQSFTSKTQPGRLLPPNHKPRDTISRTGLSMRILYLTCVVDTISGMKQLGLQGKCGECGRIFDLTDNNDARDWHYGHDCEDNNDNNEWGVS
jgi:hypothetical protein